MNNIQKTQKADINFKLKQDLSFNLAEIVKKNNIDKKFILEDPYWMKAAENVWTKHLLLDTHNNVYTDLIFCLDAVEGGLHYHHGPAYSYIINGVYGNIKEGEKVESANTGSFIYAPAGSMHTPYMEIENGYFLGFSVTHGAVVYLDNNQNVINYSDVFTQVAKLKRHFHENKLPLFELDLIIK